MTRVYPHSHRSTGCEECQLRNPLKRAPMRAEEKVEKGLEDDNNDGSSFCTQTFKEPGLVYEIFSMPSTKRTKEKSSFSQIRGTCYGFWAHFNGLCSSL